MNSVSLGPPHHPSQCCFLKVKKYKEKDQSFSESSLVINYRLSPQKAVPPINPTDALFSWKSACCCCRRHCPCCHQHQPPPLLPLPAEVQGIVGLFTREDLPLAQKQCLSSLSLSLFPNKHIQVYTMGSLTHTHTHTWIKVSQTGMCVSSHKRTHSPNHKGKHETCCLQPQGHGSNGSQCMEVNEKKLAEWTRHNIFLQRAQSS